MKNLNINKILLIIIVFIGVVLLYPNSVCAEEYDKVSNVVIFVKGSDDSRDIFNVNTNWNLIEKMYNKNEIGSIDNSFKNYIKTISEGKLEVENYFPQESEDKASVNTYTLSKSISEYKSSDSIVEEVIDAVKNSKISYNINSKLDNMNTSYLDNLTIIVQDNSDNSIIGSHKAEYSGTNKINGLSVSNYNIIPSADLVSDDGTIDARYAQSKISHEFLHTLGLPDLYRKTDVGEPVGSWDIMAKVGYVLQYPLSYLRYKQGWIGSNEITKSGTYTLDAVSGTGSNKLFILKTPLSDSEYIALEYRKKSTNLTDIESGIPNSGLLMYRINNKVEDSTNVRGKNYIYIYRPDVVDKDSGNDLIESGDYKGFNKYYNATLSPEVSRTEYGSTDLTKSFTDNTLYYSDGQNSGIKISNVKYSDNKKQTTFDVNFANYNEENLWNSTGVLSGNAYGSILYKDKKNNLMYIAYSNGSGSSSKVSVKKINGNTLEQVGNEINDANYPSLAIYNNDLYIMTQNFNGYLEIYKLDGSTWTKISEYKTNYPKNTKLIESNSGLYAMYEETVSGYTTKLTIKDVINNKVIAEREAQDFGNPAVSFYNNKIYLAYSSYFDSDNSAKIESFDLTKNEWKVEKKLTINKSNIHSIKQYGNKLYILVGADGISPIVYTYDGTTWSEDKIDLMSNYSNLNMNIINDNIYISYINTKDNKSYLLKLSNHKSEIIDSNLGSDYSYLYTENDKENMYAITSDANSNSISIKTKKIEIEDDNKESSNDNSNKDNTESDNSNENINQSKNGWVVENGNTYYYKNGNKLTGRNTIDGVEYYFDNTGIMHGNILFLGDSLTDYYNLSKYYQNEFVINSGIAGNTTDNILNNMYNRVYKYNPSKVFLLIGTNDINGGKSTDYVVNNINKIITLIRKNLPNCKIYLESLYPINNTNNSKINHFEVGIRTNKIIKEINSRINNISDVTYINMYDKLVDSNDNLKLEYTKEGLHMSDDGYVAITNVLKNYMNDPDGSSNIKDKWYYENNSIYYYKDGTMLKGIQWLEEEGSYFFFGENTGKLFTTPVVAIDGTAYYPDSQGRIKTGWTEIDGNKYYYDKNFKMLKGIQWLEEEGGYFFFGENTGKLFTTPVVAIDGTTYYPDSDGKLTTGWKKYNNKKYYTVFGKPLKGFQKLDELYFFNESTGELLYGWITALNGDVYYSNQEGIIQTGDVDITNGTEKLSYYFGEDGKLYTGWRTIGEDTFYYLKGLMKKGITNIDNKNYFLGELTGKLWKNDWVTALNGDKYYTDENGIVQTGIISIDNKKYFLGELSGKLWKGWVTALNGNIYHTNEEGIIETGLQQIDGKPYIFNEDGVLQSGWQTINNEKYYFFPDSSRAMGIQKIAGKRYLFSNTGVCLKENVKLWIDVSHHNDITSWDDLWNSGEIDGVIIRIGYGSRYIDKKAKENIAAVKRLGIPYSIYYYSYAENAAEARREAENMLFLYRTYEVNLSLPTYYDIEEYTNLSKSTYQSIIDAYKGYLESNGIPVRVYASKSLANANFKEHTEWVAHYTGDVVGYSAGGEEIRSEYPNRLTDFTGWKIWQYTNNGHVTGINGRVDFDIVI